MKHTNQTEGTENPPPEFYGEVHAPVYDKWYGEKGKIALSQIGTAQEVANGIAVLADGGPILELGVGTGRLALPMADLGLDITGLDSSPAMLKQLREKPSGDKIKIVEADMAMPSQLSNKSFSVVLVGFNTFFNLTTVERQTSCIAEVARLLRPGGRFIVEAFVPQPEFHEGISVRMIAPDVVLIDSASIEPNQQLISGERIEVTPILTRRYPYILRYISPTEFDAIAADNGLSLEHRWADWARNPFSNVANYLVSIWRTSQSSLG